MRDIIPFNRPFIGELEGRYVNQCFTNRHFSGDGKFTKICQRLLESQLKVQRALLTHSCTAALEMTAILSDVNAGDEIIMPSFTFVSTANAFVLRGGVPVFVDIRADTLNIDEKKIEDAITERTKAIVVVHYAGVPCDMDPILEIAKRHSLLVIEDVAQGIYSTYKGKSLGGIGDFGAISFHETKNIISGEGGALFLNNEIYIRRSEIIREKGTDRSQFFRGEVDKYTWHDVGSSYLPGEIIAAFLAGQLESGVSIVGERIKLWKHYHSLIQPLTKRYNLRLPCIPDYAEHNGHMYFVILPRHINRSAVIEFLAGEGVQCVSHYEPLHDSPAGKRFGRSEGHLINTEAIAPALLRLPLWVGMEKSHQERVVHSLDAALFSVG